MQVVTRKDFWTIDKQQELELSRKDLVLKRAPQYFGSLWQFEAETQAHMGVVREDA